jgi:Flp pilus assembly protein TadG
MTTLNHDERPPVRVNALRRFVNNARGSIAIEFAALAIPFSLLVFAILESCISFAAQQVLSNVADQARYLGSRFSRDGLRST